MGQARITSGGPDGLYNITLIKHAAKSATELTAIGIRLTALTGLITAADDKIATELAALAPLQNALSSAMILFDGTPETRKAVTDAQAAVMSKQTDVIKAQSALSLLKAEEESIEKRQTMLTAAMATEARTAVWCTDLTEDLLAGTVVGTMEMNGVDDEIIIAPGGKVSESIGLLQHAGVSTGAAVFCNRARLPAWQKWKPTYRVGRMTEIDYDLDTCKVGIEDQYSREQGLKINQAGPLYTAIKAAISGWDDFASKNGLFPLVTNTSDTNLTVTAQLLNDLNIVNNDVNNRYHYSLDEYQYGKLENWTIMDDGGSGDCEDFALTKASKLLALGYPASALHIEVGMVNGVGHAWLVVQTNNGDLALDNRYQTVMNNSSLPYYARQRQTGMDWKVKGVLLSDVTIEYMDGINSDAFDVDDNVVVQFVGQNWNAPKVVGFETNPKSGQEIYATYQSGTWIRSVGAYTINGVFKYNLDITILPANYSTFINVVLSSFSDGPFVFAQSLDYLAQGPKMKCEFWINETKIDRTYSFWQDAIASYYASKSVAESDVSVTLGGSFLVGNNFYVSFFTICEGYLGYWLNGIVCFQASTGTLLGMRTFAYSLGLFANYGPSPSICVNGGYIYTPDTNYDATQGIIRITPISFESAVAVSLGSGRTIAMAAYAGADRFYGVYYNVAIPAGAQNLYLAVFEHGATSAKHTVNLPLRRIMLYAVNAQVKMAINKSKLVVWFKTYWNDTAAYEYRRFTCDPLTGAIEKNETGIFSTDASEITIVELGGS